MRFLDASADDASYEEMAQVILGINPAEEPVRAESREKPSRSGELDDDDRLQGVVRLNEGERAATHAACQT